MAFDAFEPAQLRHLKLSNRFLVAPMATQYADKEGRVTDTLLKYYTHIARTGAGAVIVEAAAIFPFGRGWSRELAAWPSDCVAGFAKIADAIRSRGAAAFLQLHHAGRQSLTPPAGQYVVGPSAVSCPVLNNPTRALSGEEIKRLVVAFTEAAGKASEAGFDGIELHGAHGYLLHQFCSPLTNRRRDEYRLEADGLSRFPLEVVRSIRAAYPDLIISYRMSARDYLPGGLTLKQSTVFARALQSSGADLIHVSGGMYASLHGPEAIVGPSTPPGVFVSDAREIRGAVDIPVAVVGKIGDPALALKIFANEDADFVALGRPLLRDPKWLYKAQKVSLDPIRPCLLCMRCRYHHRGCPDGNGEPDWQRT
ncbi:MAG TPA: NADH:flavin oxidoreductase [Candidatus Ozemobacteraceae bacterium]|nr:NADH:flavin oxidoreductase [Candidatus Ozemobacteraceae bacterium]HQG28496.1 NADH:flavin oxidoreductase [Candidatus Ozemobacteraceae bacterium]